MLRAEGVLLAVCLVQMVKAMRRLLAVQLVLRRRQDHGPVSLLGQAKSAAPLLRPEPLDPRQLVVAGCPLHELQSQ